MRDRWSWIVAAILFVALAVRVGFVLGLPQRALYWDEPLYENWAKGYVSAFPSLFGDANAPSFLQAFHTSQPKGELYTFLVGLVYASAGAQPRAVYVLQAVLDALTCLLVFGLARALAGVRAGLIAMALAAVYEPFIFSAARLQTETLTMFLVVGALWALCVPERRRRLGHLVAGGWIAASMLARPATQALFAALLPTVPVRNWDRPWRERVVLVLVFTGGFLIVGAPHWILSGIAADKTVWSGTLDPSADMYGGAILGNAGWKTDRLSFANPPRDELLAVLGDDAKRTPQLADYRAATIRTWWFHPVGSAAVALHKLYVAWSYPYNDSRWTFLSGNRGITAYHRVVLLLGLIGMPLALQRWRVGVPLIVATLYLWAAYLVIKIEVRYAVLAMPTMICFAGVAIATFSRGWQRAWQHGTRRRLLALAIGAGVGVFAAETLSIERLLQWLPLAPVTAHGARVAVIIAAMACVTYLAAELSVSLWTRSTALALLAPALAIGVLVVLFGRPLADTWHEWQSTLAPDRGIVSQEFVLPASGEAPQSGQLKLDLLPAAAGRYDVVVRVNGEEVRRYRGGLTRSDADLPRENYYQMIFTAQRRTEPENAWYTVPIDPQYLVPGAHIAVEVALQADGDPPGSLAIIGDYAPAEAVYDGPSLRSPALPADTSLFKYLADGDYRMRRRVPLSGTSHSRFFDGQSWSERDLAFDAGGQQGRYRIFLVLVYAQGIAIL